MTVRNTAGDHAVCLRAFVVLLSVTLAESATALSLPFVDDFEDGDAAGWTIVSSTTVAPSWFVSSGRFFQGNRVETVDSFDQTYHLGTYAVLSDGLALTDYRFSVDATFLSTVLSDDIGVMFRYADADNYYRFTLNARYGFSRLEKKVGGVFRPLAVNSRGYELGKVVRITVNVQGSKIQIAQDDEPLFAVEDASLHAGSVALYTQERSSFDNVLIEPVSSLPPAITIATPTAHSVKTSNILAVSAIATQVPAGGRVVFSLDGANPITDPAAPYTAQYASVARGSHTVEASLRDAAGVELARDTNTVVGTGGEYIVAIGDSITNGIGDDFGADNVSQSGRVQGNGVAAPLTDLLEASLGKPVIVYNEGIGGDESLDTAFKRVRSIVARHPESRTALVLLGTNDSGMGFPSGAGCRGAACDGTFKGYMQSVIDTLTAAGKTVYVALVPPSFGYAEEPFANARKAWQNVDHIEPYNELIRNELTNRQLGPNLFDYFLGSSGNRYSLFADTLHPNALGHVVMAHLWHNALNPASPVPLPFVLDDLSRSTAPPYLKQNLLETGDAYYVDAAYTLSSIPTELANGRWIMTANADSGSTASDYLTFRVDRAVTVYVAYDSGASRRPAWMSSFADSGMIVRTTNPASPTLSVYARTYAAGSVTLGGNLAPGTGGADANYLVVVVPH